MDKIEHDIATTGFDLQDRAKALRPLVATIEASDAELAGWLAGALGTIDLVGRELERIASSWHYVER